MSGPFGVRMTLISGGQQSGEIVVTAATFLSMAFLTMDCVCTDRHVRPEFVKALKHFTGRPGMDVYKGPDFFAKALVGPDGSISTKGLFWLALDKAGESLARDIFHSQGELAETRVYHSVHKFNLIEPPILTPPAIPLPVHGREPKPSGEEKMYTSWFESLYQAILPWRQIVKNIQSDFSQEVGNMSHVNIEGNAMQIEALMEKIVSEVKHVKGVRGMVLGGSRARGTHTPASDIDLGIYYHPDDPLDLVELSRIAAQLDDEHRADLITEISGWGPWINGGGWLRVDSQPVDFLYRDLKKVTSIIEDCLYGTVEIVYQPGHPHGFVSSIYLAEMAVCRPLWDPEGIISELKEKTYPYPLPLQEALIRKFAWEIDFSLQVARKSIERADVTYAAGCCFRSVMCMLQVVFAINREYWLNEKGAIAIVDTFVQKPPLFKLRVEEAIGSLEPNPEAIQQAIGILEGLGRDVRGIVSGI